MRRLAAVILLAACATAPPPPAPATPAAEAEPSNPALATELRAMLEEDQDVRRRWLKDQSNQAIKDEAETLRVRHVARLQQIVDQYGWPGKSMAGVKGGGAAWTIAQHGGPEFLGKMLPLMYEAVKQRELEEGLYATSLDRVLVNRGQKQLYGTQFDTDPATGKCEPKPIDDPARVDERRIRAGLGPLADYREQLCKIFLGK